MLRGLLVTHGELGHVLAATAERIVGAAGGIEVLSNEGHSRESLARAVEERLAAWHGAEGVVLTDVPGGSCTVAALSRLAAFPHVRAVSGVNLTMLVDFLANRERAGAAEMAERLETRGRAAVRILAAPPGTPGGPQPA